MKVSQFLVSQFLGQQGNHVLGFYNISLFSVLSRFNSLLIFCLEYRSFLIFSDCPVLVSYSKFVIKKMSVHYIKNKTVLSRYSEFHGQCDRQLTVDDSQRMNSQYLMKFPFSMQIILQ